jgi:hypothetical protein
MQQNVPSFTQHVHRRNEPTLNSKVLLAKCNGLLLTTGKILAQKTTHM